MVYIIFELKNKQHREIEAIEHISKNDIQCLIKKSNTE